MWRVWTIIGLMLCSPVQAQVTEEQVRAYAGTEIISIRASDTLTLLDQAKGKPVLLLVYASWCGYCKELMVETAALQREGALNGIHPLYLSLDKRYEALAAYILERGYAGLFTPYLVKANSVNTLGKTLRALGSTFTGGIPYLALFDADGNLVAQTFGVVTRQDLQAMVQQLRK